MKIYPLNNKRAKNKRAKNKQAKNNQSKNKYKIVTNIL